MPPREVRLIAVGTVPRLNGKYWGGDAPRPAVKTLGLASSMYEVLKLPACASLLGPSVP